jgi:alkylation response protein AidB-like acyl-CoA dehydrogenase
MDFSLTEDQELLQRTARDVLGKACPPSVPRAMIEDRSAIDQVWPTLAGWQGLADQPLVDLCLFLEETGAVLAPGPFLPTVALFAPLVAAVDHPLGAEVLAGEATGTVAMAGADGRWAVSDESVRTFVIDADLVDHVAVVLPGPSVLVVEAAGLQLRRVETVDLVRAMFELSVPQDTGAAQPVAVDALDAVVERATVALAAEMCGVSRWLLDRTVDYAKERVQFDHPIGSFQAVQHKLADMALEVERAWSTTCYAAMALDAVDADRHRAAHVAKAAAGAAARRCAKDGIQIHGGIGYTWEHDLHLYLRRAFASEHLLGTSTWHHDRLADLLLS